MRPKLENYSFLIGLKKTAKNTLIVLGPALLAGLTTFSEEVPMEYQFLTVLTGFVAYFLKNFVENTKWK